MERATRRALGATTHSRFSVDDLPEGRKFDAWRESISCIFDVEQTRTQARGDPFHATLDSYSLAGLLLVRGRTRAQNWARSAMTVARDGMDHFMVQTYVDGSQRLDHAGGEVDMPQRGLLVYDLSREMRATSTDLANISLVLPRPLVEPLLADPDAQHLRALDERNPMTALFLDHMMALWRRARHLAEHEHARLAAATAQLLAASLNGADPAEDDPASEAGAVIDGALLRAMRRDIEARLTDPYLGVDDLCRRHAVSRSRLYRLFAPQGGVAAYIRERRLRAALTMLADPMRGAQPVGAIGQALAFSSASDFSRAFQRRFGVSPRAARHYGARARADGRGQAPDRVWETWLHRLSA